MQGQHVYYFTIFHVLTFSLRTIDDHGFSEMYDSIYNKIREYNKILPIDSCWNHEEDLHMLQLSFIVLIYQYNMSEMYKKGNQQHNKVERIYKTGRCAKIYNISLGKKFKMLTAQAAKKCVRLW